MTDTTDFPPLPRPYVPDIARLILAALRMQMVAWNGEPEEAGMRQAISSVERILAAAPSASRAPARDLRIAQICELYNYHSKANPDSGWLQEFAREVLSIAAAPSSSRAPAQDGWQLVPKEPTPEMVRAGWEKHPSAWGDAIVPGIYKAMIAAAPSAQAPTWEATISSDGSSQWEQMDRGLRKMYGAPEADWQKAMLDKLALISLQAPAGATPAQILDQIIAWHTQHERDFNPALAGIPAAPVGQPTAEDVLTEIRTIMNGTQHWPVGAGIVDAIRALAAAPPVPVADDVRAALVNLLRAVELEMSVIWDCNSYHPALARATEAARRALSAQQEGK